MESEAQSRGNKPSSDLEGTGKNERGLLLYEPANKKAFYVHSIEAI